MSRLPSKKKKVGLALIDRSLNRFEAERIVNDHTLNSTVSTLRNLHGLPIEGNWETVPGWKGVPVRVIRYQITDENKEVARLKLDRMS
jgi:hypothetical protein